MRTFVSRLYPALGPRQVDPIIDTWAPERKRGNIRALLATLDTIVWPEAKWKGYSISDLVCVGLLSVSWCMSVCRLCRTSGGFYLTPHWL